MDEVESIVDVKASEVGIDDSYLNELVSTYGNKAYSVIEEEFSDDLSQEIIDLFEDKITYKSIFIK